ncbi:MAG: hypothetical protein E7320_02385 [Clostridiales bacterium]|nr:hypothetical protein [Clostridiales bacterium]
MEFLFELLFELAAEGTVELSKSVRVPRPVRFLLIGIIVLFSVAVIGVMLLASIMALKENVFFGIVLLAITLFMLVMGVIRFRETYLKKKAR